MYSISEKCTLSEDFKVAHVENSTYALSETAAELIKSLAEQRRLVWPERNFELAADRLTSLGILIRHGSTVSSRVEIPPPVSLTSIHVKNDSRSLLRAVQLLERLSLFRYSTIGWRTAFGLALLLVCIVWRVDMKSTVAHVLTFGPGLAFLVIPVALLSTLYHEAGHTSCAARSGVRVTRAGIGIYITSPVLFVDLSAIGVLPKKQRMLIDAAGLLNQIVLLTTVTTLATVFDSALIVRDVLLMITISTLIFELCPLVKSDGYWLIKDFFDAPIVPPLTLGSLSSLRTIHPTYRLRATFGIIWLILQFAWAWTLVQATAGFVSGPDFDLFTFAGQLLAIAFALIGFASVLRYLVNRRRGAA